MIKKIAFLFLCFSACLAIEEPNQETLNKEVTDFEARLEYARLLSYKKDYDKSLAQYSKLLRDNPSSIPAQTGMAEVLYYQGKQQEALGILEKIPEKDLPTKTLLLIGDISLSLKDYPKAEAIYKKHLKDNPSDDSAKFKLAELYSWQKKYNESIVLYQEILKDNPDDIQVRRKYGMTLMWMGNEDQAAVELKKTLSD